MRLGAAAAEQLVGFKRHMRAEVSNQNDAYLFSERGVTALHGAQVAALAALLDGTRDLATLVSCMPGGMGPEQIASVVGQLVEADLVTLRPPGEPRPDDREIAYWDASGIDSCTAARGIARRVGLVTVGGMAETAATEAALRAAGLDVTTDVKAATSSTDLSVVLCDDYLNPVLSEIDGAHRAAKRPWLLAKPLGAQVWIGPVFEPEKKSGCWHCLANRLWGHRQPEACAQAVLGHHGPALRPAVSVPALTAAAVHLIALEATKWLTGYRYPGQQCVWVLESLDLQGRRHNLRARPQCAACGDTSLVASEARKPVTLSSAKKVSYSGSGHRSLTSDEVLDRYRHLISPVTGVVKEIKRDARGPAFLNSFRSGPNTAAKVDGLNALRTSLRDESGGKGTTAVDAEAGALCEALERYCGRFQGDEERVRGSLRSLGEQAIHPNTCMLFDQRQYATRAEWNTAHSPFQYVCDPVDEHAEIDWTPVWSLTEQRHRLLPTGMLYYGAPRGRGGRCVRADSNGNAAGSSIEDAVLQAMLELVERDAVALWWYNRTLAPGVDLNTFNDPWIDGLTELYAELGREVWVLDVTSDLLIPAMVAVSRRTNSPREDITFGFGAHLDPRVALRRALTELNQLMPALLDADPDTSDDSDAVRWWRHASIADQAYVTPNPNVLLRALTDFNYTPRQDLFEDIYAIKTSLEALGMELLVLDQTRPDIELPVVKVIAPGMRHFWARFAPGRLYEVPVRLGRLNEPTPYENLNPMPMFM